MNGFFVSDDEYYSPAFRSDPTARHTEASVRERRNDDSAKLNELAADVVVVDGPNRTGKVRVFFDEDVEGNWQTRMQPLGGSERCVEVAVCIDLNKFRDPSFEW